MDETLETLDKLITAGILLLVAVSLLAFGAVVGWWRGVVILLAACLLFCWGIRQAIAREIRWLSTPMDAGVVAFTLLYLIQMAIGFPWGWSAGISPDAVMTRAVDRPGSLPFIPGTLDYHATRDALVLFLVYVTAFYLVVQSLRTRPQMDRLISGICGLAALVAFYGLVESLSGSQGIFGWKEYGSARVRGTLVNPDHFATYLGVAIPLAAAYLIGVGAGRRRRQRTRVAEASSSEKSLDGPASQEPEAPTFSLFDRKRSSAPWERESRQLILGFGCALSIVGLVFTLSRAGIIGFLGGGLFFVALLWIREPGHRRQLAGIGIALAAFAIIIWIGLEPVLERFAAFEEGSFSRARLYRDVVPMVRDFPILGSGLGTFGRVFPRYASPEFTFTTRMSHAHNEPLQLVAEGGVVAVLIVALTLVMVFRDLLFRRILGLFPGNSQFAIRNSKFPPASATSIPHSAFRIPHSASVRHDPYSVAIAIGCLSSLVAVSVHSLFDFPLRIPANGILLSTVLGIAVVAVGIRFRADGAETLLPTRTIALSRLGRLVSVLGIGVVALFMGWTAIAAALAEGFSNRGYEIIAGVSGPGRQGEKPWVVETERNREALSNLGLAVQLDPLQADGQYRLGRLYEQLALRAWNAGLSAEGKFIPDLRGRARASLEILGEAMRRYALAIRLVPTHAEAWGRLGWAYGIRGQIAPLDAEASRRVESDRDLALAGMRQAIAFNPNNRYRHEVLAAFGFVRLDERRRGLGGGQPFDDPIVIEGIRAQQHTVEIDPGYLPEALARLLRFTQDPAILFQAIPAQAPDMLFAARILEDQELWLQAKVLFQRAIDLAPDDGKPLYYREYAEALARRGEDAEARDILRVVLRFDPQNLDLQLALAGSLHRLKQESEALQVYQGAVELATATQRESGTAPAHKTRGSAAPDQLPREQRVIEAIQKRFPAPKRTAEPVTRALGALAAFYHDQGRDDLAVPLWEKAIGATPDDAATAFGLAKSYDAVGAWVSAIDYYKRAIELNKGNLEYRLTLAERYYENDMTFQAINLWREIVAVRPTLVAARLKLAGAYARLEQYPGALREYERVLQLDPANVTARDGLMRLRGRAIAPAAPRS